MPIVSSLWDIKSLIEHYASIQVVSSATSNGVLEYHSNCPWCGGTDRFITRPETGQYTCATRSNGCGKHGDGIDFLTEYMNMSTSEARALLEIPDDRNFADSKPTRVDLSSKELPPNKKWQETGLILVERAEKALWTQVGKEMLDYLLARGLTEETIKHFRYGYMPLNTDGKWFQSPFEDWGLDPALLSPGQLAKGCVKVPPGIIIPWFQSNILWKIAIKRPGNEPAYGQVMGSGEGLYNVSSIQIDEPVLMLESEFCVASVWQEARDLVNVVATGSTTRARTNKWIMELHDASFVLQGYDDDPEDGQGKKAGDEGAAWWIKTLGEKRCMRWEPIGAKDPNDMLKSFGGSYVRDWVRVGLDTWQETQKHDECTEPPARASTPQPYQEALTAPPVGVSSYQSIIAAQEHYERLYLSERVITPLGPGIIWDMKQLREHIDRGRVRVEVDAFRGRPDGCTELFAPSELEAVIEIGKIEAF